MKKAVIFLPETGIFPYLRTLSILGESLSSRNYNIYCVSCNGVLPRCPMMPCHRMPFDVTKSEMEKKCEICRNVLFRVASQCGFKIINLQTYNTQELQEKLNSLIDGTSNFEDIKYKGLAVGKIAKHDLMIETKVLSTHNLTKDQLLLYKKYIYVTALTRDISERIIFDYSPEMILTFNPYSQTHGVLSACRKHNIKFWNITNNHHLGANFALFALSNFSLLNDYINHIQNWNRGKDIPLSEQQIGDAFDDALFRMYKSDSHIFSSKKQADLSKLFRNLGLKENKKIIGVFTSSFDERMGLTLLSEVWNAPLNIKTVFKNTSEWLEYLLKFSQKRNDVQFIIRIHPREEFIGCSEHLKILKGKFSAIDTENFKIIWPKDAVSTYDILEFLDGCLIDSSTVGIESYRLGIPVLSQTSNLSYPNSGFLNVASNINDYEAKLVSLINAKSQMKDLISAARFYNWRTFASTIDLRKEISEKADENIVPTISKKSQNCIADVLENKIDITEYNVSKLTNVQNSSQKEIEAIKLNIRKIIDRLYFPDITVHRDWKWKLRRFWAKIFARKKVQSDDISIFTDYTLRYSEDVSWLKEFVKLSKRKKNRVFIIKDGVYSILIRNGKCYKRLSKMISNLARIHEESLIS